MPRSKGRAGRPWRRAQAELKATTLPVCTATHCLCPTGRTIDLTLHPNHRWAWTAGHAGHLALGADPYHLRGPEHRACNSSDGAKVGNRLRRPSSSCMVTSEQW